MTVTHYRGSKGPVEIVSMHFSHLQSARNLLKQKIEEGSVSADRQGEVDAMTAEMAVKRAAFRDQQRAISIDPASTEEQRSLAQSWLARLDEEDAAGLGK